MSALRARNMGVDPHFPLFCHTSDLNVGPLVPVLKGNQHYRLKAGTGWAVVSTSVYCGSVR